MGLRSTWTAWRRRGRALPSFADDGSLVLLAGTRDPAEAASAVLARAVAAGGAESEPMLLRHELVLPAAEVGRAAEVVAQDDYALRVDEDGVAWASRTQVCTTLSLSQESSRMAGLAQRLRGDALGFDLLAPPPAPPG